MIGTVISAVIYQLFMLAVLAQSIWQGWPVDTNQWQEQLSCNSWLAALAIFLILLASPILLLTSPAAPSIIESDAVVGADHEGNGTFGSQQANHTLAQSGDPALEGDWVLALYAFVFCIFLVQLATIYYAYLRKDLGRVLRLDARFRYGRCSASLCPCNRGFWRRDGVLNPVNTHDIGVIRAKGDGSTTAGFTDREKPGMGGRIVTVSQASRNAAEGVTSEEIDTQRGTAAAVGPHS